MAFQSRVLIASLLGTMLLASSLFADPAPPAAGAASPAAAQETPKDNNKWMQIKLHASQQILAGLTQGDLEAVENEGRRLLVFNLLENWVQNKEFTGKSEYQGQLNAFEFAAKELVRNSKARDLDGALDAYVLLTRSCVECHKLIRDVPASR